MASALVPMFIDYKDLDLLSKLTNRHGKIVGRRKTGCQASSQHAVSKAIKRAPVHGDVAVQGYLVYCGRLFLHDATRRIP